jgi:hypothetical protein
MSGFVTNTGRALNDQWGVGAAQALYHKDGNWYEPLLRFPGALFDPNGYVLFPNKSEYESCSYIAGGVKIHVPGGISQIPGYVHCSQLGGASTKAPNQTPGPGSAVEGTTVTLADGTMYVLGSDVTLGSPVGAALYGKKAGDTVDVTLPSGAHVQMTIERVE